MSCCKRWFRPTRKSIACAVRRQVDGLRDRLPAAAPTARTARNGASSCASAARNEKGNFSAYGSRKKSNGLMTVISATRSTSTVKCRTRLRENDARQIIALRILLPVEEVALRFDLERIGRDRRAAMRRGPQPDHLRRQLHQAVVVVDGLVMQRDANRHSVSLSARPVNTSRLSTIHRRRPHWLRAGAWWVRYSLPLYSKNKSGSFTNRRRSFRSLWSR